MRHAWMIIAALLTTTPAMAKKPAARGEAALAKLLEGRVAGKPVRCLPLQTVRGTQVFDNAAIVYRGNNDTLFVNRTQGAQFLDRDDILVSRVTGTQLCRLDSIRLLDRMTRMDSGFAVLDDFIPYTKPGKAKR
jgi:hypothetical protein